MHILISSNTIYMQRPSTQGTPAHDVICCNRSDVHNSERRRRGGALKFIISSLKSSLCAMSAGLVQGSTGCWLSPSVRTQPDTRAVCRCTTLKDNTAVQHATHTIETKDPAEGLHAARQAAKLRGQQPSRGHKLKVTAEPNLMACERL